MFAFTLIPVIGESQPNLRYERRNDADGKLALLFIWNIFVYNRVLFSHVYHNKK